MKREKSCGAVIYTVGLTKIKYLLVKQKNGYYGFPKGHVENEETELETAKREIKEETGLDVNFNEGFREEVEYAIPDKDETIKTVVYFLADYKNQKVKIQETEIEKYVLVDFKRAMNFLKYENTLSISFCRSVTLSS